MKPEVKNEFQEVYQEIDGLKDRLEKLEAQPEVYDCKGEPYLPPHLRAGAPIPQSEGHPIPDYDEEACQRIFNAVFKNTDKIREAEAYLIDATLDYLDHHESFNVNGPMGEKQLREWGHEDYRLHTAMKDAARDLSAL